MSYRKSKLDLLVRVRYANPLPAPPCPPKLLEVPTNPMRYARPAFLDAIAQDTPLPMIVDEECGMPLDLSKYDCLWEENADDSQLNPSPKILPTLDPADLALISDPGATPSLYSNGLGLGLPPSTSTTSSPLPAHVPWLRKTEYISREVVTRGAAAAQEPRMALAHAIDISRGAQLQTIEASFAACNGDDTEEFDLNKLRHPNKPDIVAVESHEVFPDAEIWANAYDLFKFSERPGERSVDVEDPRLDCAILRPMESDGDHFLAYYLTEDDASALTFKQRRAMSTSSPSDDTQQSPISTAFHFVRDYETVKIEQDVQNEFLLVLDDGNGAGAGAVEELQVGEAGANIRRRGKGAYYKNIERKMNLKKKRVNIHEIYDQKWEVINITHGSMDPKEKAEREEALAEVLDPDYMLGRDADGEPDVDETDGTADGNASLEADVGFVQT